MKSIYSTRSQIANGVYTTRHFKDKLLKIQTLVSYNGKQINLSTQPLFFRLFYKKEKSVVFSNTSANFGNPRKP